MPLGSAATLLHGDCLDLLPSLAAGSVDLILADLPYGTTACKWDSCIPLDKLWPEYKRVLTPRGAVVLTACQPFTSALVMSNLPWFRFADVWDKRMPVGHLNAKKRPLRCHEDVVLFSPAKHGRFTYNPQMRTGAYRRKGGTGKQTKCYGQHTAVVTFTDQYYPTSIIDVPIVAQHKKIHSTQKPLTLMAYLIRTYSNPGDLVLDNTMGSGTTGVAAINEGRRFIGMEQDAAYFQIAQGRIAAAHAETA